MKKFKKITFTLLVILLTQTIAFAQDLSDFGDTTNQNANNLDAPIDTNLWALLLVGLLYVCSKYKTRSKA